jgi:hypothetical protein
MTGKIYEMLRSGPVVLARAKPEDGPAHLVRDLQAGYVVPHQDHQAAAEILRELYRAWRAGQLPRVDLTGKLGQLSREQQAEKLLRVLEDLAPRERSRTPTVLSTANSPGDK